MPGQPSPYDAAAATERVTAKRPVVTAGRAGPRTTSTYRRGTWKGWPARRDRLIVGVNHVGGEVPEHVDRAPVPVDEDRAARPERRPAAHRVGADERDVAAPAASQEDDVVVERGRRGVGEIHPGRLGPRPAEQVETEGPVPRHPRGGSAVRESCAAQVDLDVIRARAVEDIDVEQTRELDGVVLVGALQRDRVVAPAARHIEVRGATDGSAGAVGD